MDQGNRSAHTERRFLPEVQALRAVAVSLVVVFHFWPQLLPGGFVGVDVFFVISGFLITSHLLREVGASGRVHLGQFWARRVRRLLPAAMLVLAVTLAATVLFMPQPVWQRTATEVAASAVYAQNWVLASSAVDYFAAENAATSVQHYWSLSVEEQFYIVWPLLVLAAVVLARRRGATTRRAIGWAAGGVLLVSLAYSVWFTATSPQVAYFSTFTHAWEFAAGALTAVAVPALRGLRPADFARTRVVLAVAGLATLVVCGFVYTGEMAFPGWIALVPVIATLAVIAAGETRAQPVLAARPIQFVGDVSYSLYLWHWPVIVIAPFALGRELDTPTRLLLLAGTVLAAWVTKVAVEDPVRRARRLAAARRWSFGFAGASAVTVVAVCAAVWTGVAQEQAQAAQTAASAPVECLGAAVVLNDCPDPNELDPDLLAATEPVTDENGDAIGDKVTLPGGIAAFESGAPDADTTVALVGDSHAAHLQPALDLLAQQHGWRLLTVRHNNCTPSAPTWESPIARDMSEPCQAWRTDLMTTFAEMPGIDVVVTSSVAPRYADAGEETLTAAADAFRALWTAWEDNGTVVVVVADVPGLPADMPEAVECVAAADSTDDPCSSPRSEVVERDIMAEAAPPERLVDLTDLFCDQDECHVVVGGIVAYANGSHLSKLMAESLAPVLEAPVVAALDRTT